YILFVGRLVPENGIHVLIAAHAALPTPPPLVIVGDAPYADDYVTSLRAYEGPGVIFTGYLFGEGYRQLLHNAYMFVLPDEVGGTHPALIEAMAAGNCIVVNNHEPNVEAIGDAGLSYDGRLGAPDLARVMGQALADPALAAALGERAKSRALALYSWRSVTDAYERLCDEVTARPAEPSVKSIKRKSSKTP
ncbi:MAG: glycosyltransferase, partial [Chloroflexi bacterium]|nr:glycosyltransferase [Chloroflexota bacterium]